MSDRCSEPVSWLRLERHALGELAPAQAGAIESHLRACRSCRRCAERIRADRIRLPRLPAARRPPRPVRLFVGLGLAAGAVAALLLFMAPRPRSPAAPSGVKGGRGIAIDLVRERNDSIAYDPSAFASGDRFKVLVTCPPGVERYIDVVVLQDGETFYPLRPARIACRNRAPIPGAFRLSGSRPATVCVRAGADSPPARAPAPSPAPSGDACRTVEPVRR